MKKILCFALFFVFFLMNAQKGTLSGTIYDDQNLSLPGAKLVLVPGDFHTISNEDGSYVFLNVPEGSYTLLVEYLGFGERDYSITINASKNTTQNIIFNKKEKIIDEVVIVGDGLRGQAKALNTQKNNENISNIISSDQVGKFPDANIGDALKRVSGVTMQNDQGEARNIIIRGMAPELNSVTLNGNRIPSAEGDNRRVQMDLIPSDMIQMIEVNKTLTSDMDADAIGGSVNLITRSASEKQRISLTAGSGYSPIREKPLHNANLVYSNRFFNNILGIVINGSYNFNNYGSDNVEAVWSEDASGKAYVSQLDIRKYDVKRERKSVGLNLDFKINSKNTLRINSMYNWRDDWENRYRLRYNDVAWSDSKQAYVGQLRMQTKGGIDNSKNKAARLERQIVQNYSLNGDHLIGSKLKFDWTVSYAKASEERPNERYIDYRTSSKTANLVAFGTDQSTEKEPYYSFSPIALDKYGLKTISEQNGLTFEEEYTAKMNFRTPFSIIDGQKGRLKFGGKARFKFKKRENDFFEYSPLNSDYDNLSIVNTVHWDGKGYQPSSKYVPGTFASKQLLGNLNLADNTQFEKTDVPSEYLGLNYNATEDIYAGYLLWIQNISNKLTAIAGFRIEETKTKYTANQIEEEDDLVGKRTVSNNYTNYLPSVTLKYDVNKNLVVRAAYTTSLARPDYYRLSPFVSVLRSDVKIDAGNPDLKAAFSNNIDLTGEYYFKNIGLVSFGGFYKNIDKFIYVYRDALYNQTKFANDFPDSSLNLGTDTYIFTQARNGNKVKVYGFEVAVQRQLDFLPGFMKYFGIYANYTYTKSDADGIYTSEGEKRQGITLPGTAPHMFNSSLSWENNKFSARISLNFTDSYLDELGDTNFQDRFYDKQTFLDFNASYVVNKNMRIFVEANNLTNQPLRYYQGTSARTMQMEYYKPKYTAGLKFDF